MRIAVEEATKIIQANVQPLPGRMMPLHEAVGRILDEAVCAKQAQPPFNRSPYDGYALRAYDSKGATKNNPVTLKVVGKTLAGKPSFVTIKAGEALRIMTGGPIPEGADCVIKQELTDRGEQYVKLYAELQPYENFIPTGEDYQKGDVLVKKGTYIDASVAAVIASAGVARVKAIPLPLVGVLATGTELQELGQTLEPGQIYNSNSEYICAKLKLLGVPFINFGQIRDDFDQLKIKIKEALDQVDFLITTGGVSVGEADYIPDLLEELLSEQYFHGVQMKPGMPALFARNNKAFVLACSGNPFAAVVNFEILGRAIISHLSANQRLRPEAVRAYLKGGYRKRRPFPRYIKARLEGNYATVCKDQKNSQIKSLIVNTVLAVLPAGEAPLGEEQPISCLKL